MIKHQDRHLSMPLQGRHLRKTPQGQHCLGSITIISCADEHSSVTVASMVTPLPAKKQKRPPAKKVAAPAKKPPKKKEKEKKTKEAPIKP